MAPSLAGCVFIKSGMRCCLLVVLISLSCADVARAQTEPTTFYSEIQPGIAAKVELAAGADFDLPVVYELYFLDESSKLTTIVPGVGEPRVLHVSRGDTAAAIRMEKCRVVDRVTRCTELRRPPIIDVSEEGEFAELELPAQKIDWEGEYLRLTVPEGWFELRVCTAESCGPDDLGPPRPSPAIAAALLPTLTDRERQFMEQRPFFRFDVSPFVRDQSTGTGGFDELSVSFDGGIYRTSSSGRWLLQLKWGGDVATAKGLAFDRLSLEAGGARNLVASDWLPLTVVAKAETDRDFEAIDVSAVADLAYVLPFNVNLQTGRYRPAAAPRLRAIAAYGYAVDRGDAELEEGFWRAGYEVRWRIPVAEAALLRLHHAGVWNDPSGMGGDWHALWDILAQIQVGAVTYFVGYQEGEAAPLFRATETTRVGLSFAIERP